MSTDQAADVYRMSAEEVVAEFGSDQRRGLRGQEAGACLQHYGPNELETEKPVPAWQRFLAQFQDALIILLLVATAISVGLWVYERDTALPYEGLTIFAIVLLNGILGYVQEARAERAVAALRAMSANEATVLRDGERRSVPAAELVPGDVVLIEEGDTIPADARLIESTALQTMEASLTGESLPVSKDVAPVEDEAGLGDRHNKVFSGTAATYGRGKAIVTATGMHTELGRVAGLLSQTEEESTPLQKELDRVGKLLGNPPKWSVSRPPSQAHVILYYEMMHVWNAFFMPAVSFAFVAIGCLVLALICRGEACLPFAVPTLPVPGWTSFVVVAVILGLSLFFYWWNKPRLGTED